MFEKPFFEDSLYALIAIVSKEQGPFRGLLQFPLTVFFTQAKDALCLPQITHGVVREDLGDKLFSKRTIL